MFRNISILWICALHCTVGWDDRRAYTPVEKSTAWVGRMVYRRWRLRGSVVPSSQLRHNRRVFCHGQHSMYVPSPLPDSRHLNVGECEKRCGATKELLVNTVVSEVGASEYSVDFTTMIEHYNQCTLANCPPCTTLKRLFIKRQSTISQELAANV